MDNFNQFLSTTFLLTTSFLLLSHTPVSADTLRAGNFRVTITSNCPEGSVTCDDVTYDAVNLNTGDSIQLTGTTVHTLCSDGLTPCRFVGYEFFNGDYYYFVGMDGTLRVYRGEELILDEVGTWEY